MQTRVIRARLHERRDEFRPGISVAPRLEIVYMSGFISGARDASHLTRAKCGHKTIFFSKKLTFELDTLQQVSSTDVGYHQLVKSSLLLQNG